MTENNYIINPNKVKYNTFLDEFSKDEKKLYSDNKIFKRLGIYAIQIKNSKKILYFDIYHKKIYVLYGTKRKSCIQMLKNNKNKFSSIMELEVENDNQKIDDYFLYDITEHIEDKLKIIEDSIQKEKLFAKLSHEFKTPLNSIIGLIDSILEINHNNKCIEKLNIVKNLSNYIVFLISDIIQYTNLKMIEDLNVHMIEIDIENILIFCFQILNSLLFCNKEKFENIDTKLIISKEIKNYSIEADEFRLKQVLLNLISNSVKFTIKGKIYIKCKLKKIIDEHIVFKITIEDTGIGIKEEDKKRMFKDYEMLNIQENLKYNKTGSGLGLSICKCLTSKMKMFYNFP